MGGIGKSALAIIAAHRVSGAFPDAQLYIDLRDPEEGRPLGSEEVLGTLLRAFGRRPQSEPASAGDMTSELRSILATRRSLIVLDNARNAEQVAGVFSAAPQGAVLVTSRDPLREIDVSLRVPLEVFEESDSVRLLRTLVGDQRVDAEPAAARAIADLCGDLPLALRLAGALLAGRPAWQLTQYADTLREERDRLERLDTSGVGLRASFNLSYRELDIADKSLFRVGALFEGEFEPEAAAAVTEEKQDVTHRRLENLVDTGLLLATEVSRYRYHPLVRLFARERLEAEVSSSETGASLARLGAWYIERSASFKKAFRGTEP
jgi:hypothetical protein